MIHEEGDQLHFKVNDVKITFSHFGFEIPHVINFGNAITIPACSIGSNKSLCHWAKSKIERLCRYVFYYERTSYIK